MFNQLISHCSPVDHDDVRALLGLRHVLECFPQAAGRGHHIQIEQFPDVLGGRF